MTPAQILALINMQIISNGVGQITGPILNNILVQIVNLFTTVVPASRVVNSSSALAVLLTDNRIGINRTTSLSAMTTALPSGATPGQEFILADLSGNMNAYPNVVSAPAGTTFSGGRTTYTMNENNQTVRFAYYGQNLWGVEAA